jgi:hypothetical protein
VKLVWAAEATDTRDRGLTLAEGHEIAVCASPASKAAVFSAPSVRIGMRRRTKGAADEDAK